MKIIQFKRALPALLCGFALLLPFSAVAADCPNASTARDGFVVERSHRTTEVVPAGDRLVRIIYRSPTGETLSEVTMFEGLFDLERIDRGQRTVLRSSKNLASFFPLKIGQEIVANFESGNASQKVLLRVVRTDSLFIESCKYDVFVVERSVGQRGSAPVFAETDFYARDLKLIIAKEYKNRDGTTYLAKFDKIHTANH